MSPQFDEVLEQALALPPEERRLLAENLWFSIPGNIVMDEELFAEIERREAELEAGLVKAIPYDEVMRSLREALKPRKP